MEVIVHSDRFRQWAMLLHPLSINPRAWRMACVPSAVISAVGKRELFREGRFALVVSASYSRSAPREL